jgi:diguanylate cyclase (GGDEF)-like protein
MDRLDLHGPPTVPAARRTSLLSGLWAAPLASAVLGGILVFLQRAGLLASGAAELEQALAGLGVAGLIVGSACGWWQHRAIARPLRRLAAARPTPPVPGEPREVMLLRSRIEALAQPVSFERDPLTGLLGAAGPQAGAAGTLDAAGRQGRKVLLVVVDIDRLRDVNGAHGYGMGDDVLRLAARRLVAICPPEALVARTGGDRFAVLIPLHQDGRDERVWLGTVAGALQRGLEVEGCDIAATASGGGALYPTHATSFEQLFRVAEMALESARRNEPRRWHLFDPQLDRTVATQRALERDLRHALQRNALALHYQPQVCLATGRVTGVEALLRWPHPELGMVPPQSFIPLAEATGLIRPIGAWVLTEAAAAARRWRKQGLEIGVSINVSVAQLRRQDLAVLVGRVLDATGLPPDALELELTESMFVDPRRLDMHRGVQALAAMGVRLAIDDFGTGYSALGYLKRLPVHKIKIDKSFVRELGSNELDAAIVRSIISLARVFGKRVLAEGVEEAGQRRFLEQEGCDEAQGFLFSRPMPEEACTAFLLRQATRGAEPPALAG